MSKPENLDFDPAYRGHGPLGPSEKPPWSIGGPQPDLAALVDQEMVHGEVLDAGCGEAALSLYLAEAGHRVVGLDLSETALRLAKSSATRLRITNGPLAV